MADDLRRLGRRGALLLPLAAAGCQTIDRWFGERKTPLPGTRVAVGTARRGLSVDNPAGRLVTLPPQAANAAWPQSGFDPTHVPGNPAFGGGLAVQWTANIGAPSGYRRKITASPVVGGGRVFAMDSDAVVSAYDVRSGQRIWRVETELPHTRSTNVGGGVSLDGSTLYVGTGLAAVLALDAATGKVHWRQPLPAPARAAPTIVADRLYLPTMDQQVLALSKTDGTRQWAYQGPDAQTTMLGIPSPAFADELVVAGLGSGELVCLRAASGSVSWSDTLSAVQGGGSLADFAAITGLPVVTEGRVFAGGMGGLFVSNDLRTGRRLWERDFPLQRSPWLAGDWLFVLTPNQIMGAVNRDDGAVAWATQLPLYRNEKDREGPILWIGPVLAGDRLVALGDNREAILVNPVTGAIETRAKLPGKPVVPAAVAERTLFVVNEDATLLALR